MAAARTDSADELAAPLDLLLTSSAVGMAERLMPNASWSRFALNLARQPRMVGSRAKELGHDGLVAPLTFMSILAVMIQRHFFQHVDIGFETMQIVQVDQRFKFHRPIVEGDELRGTMHIDSVDERFGADIVTSRNVLTDEKTGEVVMESRSHKSK